jgi:hypothetical protein
MDTLLTDVEALRQSLAEPARFEVSMPATSASSTGTCAGVSATTALRI